MVGAPDRAQPVMTRAQLLDLQSLTRRVFVDPALMEYGIRVASATRDLAAFGLRHLAPYVTYGASPRASINLALAAQALALVRGREYALPEDVRALAPDVLRHRLVLSYEALADNVTPDDIVAAVLAAIPLPDLVMRGSDVLAEHRQWAPPPR
jgi:MoxR-like ATPase